MTAFQGIFRSEGTPEARGLPQNKTFPPGAARSNTNLFNAFRREGSPEARGLPQNKTFPPVAVRS